MCLAIAICWRLESSSWKCKQVQARTHRSSPPIAEGAVLTEVEHAVPLFCALPFRQSSVYCFYDPEYRALALGKLTALKETEFVKEVRFAAWCWFFLGHFL